MRRTYVAGITCVALAVSAYVAADVAGFAPGILTYDGATVPPPTPTGSPGASPAWAALPTPLASAASNATTAPGATTSPGPTAPTAPMPTTAALTKALAPLVSVPELGPSVGVSVRDAATGTQLYAVDPDTPRAPASTTKILSAYAMASSLDPTARMKTTVVTGATPNELVLVAGGDTMLGEGTSNPDAVVGRAGLGDLAAQVAASLKKAGAQATTLRVDATYAAGPRFPAKWKAIDAREGFTQGVAMLGRASQRPKIGTPSVAVAEDSVAKALAAQLKKRGVSVTVAPLKGHGTPAPAGAKVLGQVESATYAEVIDVAMSESDDALTENLTRQAMVAAGQSPAPLAAPPAFVKAALAQADIDTTGMATLDASGLAYGQFVSTTTLSDALTLATSGREPAFGAAVANLPVAGLTGTLADRYHSKKTKAASGIPRAKTGTLTGISSLAGTTVNASGRVLTFVILADKVPQQSGTLGARAAIDRFVAALTQCKCTT